MDKAEVNWTPDSAEDFDILHLNTLTPLSIFNMFKANMGGKKVIYHVHSTAEDFEGSFRFSKLLSPVVDYFTRAVYSRADLLLAPSKYTKNILEEKGMQNVEVVSNSYCKDRLEGYDELDSESLRDSYDVDKPVVVNLAAVFERKGVPDFVGAAEEIDNVDFIWFGSQVNSIVQGSKVNSLLSDLPENTQFPGFVEDPREAFAVGDIFFFPSTVEHQPVSLLEALACEMPIVVRDIPQYEGWLEDSKNCIKADSREGFVEAIEELRDDPSLRKKLSENASEQSENHTVSRVGDRLQEVYSDCLN
ncbi:Diglucosyl diacylglycerol synthase [Candidatus Nanohalovita haloferacivicina]|nr:Diglucosyl diacylglycerol synthase [Candidatus Nanohalobia archaeon BNXNv]